MKKLMNRWLAADRLAQSQKQIHYQAMMNVLEHRRRTGGGESGNRKIKQLAVIN